MLTPLIDAEVPEPGPLTQLAAGTRVPTWAGESRFRKMRRVCRVVTTSRGSRYGSVLSGLGRPLDIHWFADSRRHFTDPSPKVSSWWETATLQPARGRLAVIAAPDLI